MVVTKRFKMGFGARLLSILEDKELSQYWLSKATGITPQGLRQIIREVNVPGWDSVVLISKALEVEPSTFYDADDPEPLETASTRIVGRPGRRSRRKKPDEPPEDKPAPKRGKRTKG